MKNKGFTLIELLAVIVVLAIISLIAIPIIANVIDKAKEGSAIDSSYGYIDALEKNIAIGEIDPSKGIRIPSSNTLSMGDIEGASILESLKIKGTKPDYVEVTFERKKVKTAVFCMAGYNLEYKNKEIVKSSTNYCGLASVKNIEFPDSDVIKENGEYYLNLVPNSTYQLNPTLDPDDNTIPVQYKSNNQSIATVSSTGLISALLTGSTKIIVHAGTKTIIVNVSVMKPSLISTLMGKKYPQEDNTDSITIEDVTYDIHVYYYNGNQDWTTSTVPNDGVFGVADDVASGTAVDAMAKKMVAVVVNGDLTIGEGVTIRPYYSTYGGPKGFTLIVKGTLTNNGTIDNSHGAYAEGEKVYLWSNINPVDNANEYEFIPASGGSGGTNMTKSGYASGSGGTFNGTIGSSSVEKRGTGGGGSGTLTRSYNGIVTNGAGAAGTSYSGGSGGGTGASCSSVSRTGENGKANGGAGGAAKSPDCSTNPHNSGGGAGNPGGLGTTAGGGATTAGKGSDGTGGLLIIYANNIINNSTGKMIAIGAKGGLPYVNSSYYNGGGSSGGGSINIFYKNNYTNNNTSANNGIDANGGAGNGISGHGIGGPGGNGSITIGSIKTGTFVANS